MLTAAEIKKIRSLREKKYRDEYGLFVVEGEKLVAEALDSGWDVEGVWRIEEIGERVMARLSSLSTPPPVLAVLRKRPDTDLPAAPAPSSGTFLPTASLPSSAAATTSPGIPHPIAPGPSPSAPTATNAGGRRPTGLSLALDGIRDPGNLGTILRAADWFGVDAVYASPDTVDLYNPKVVQSTMGAIFRVAFHYTDLPALCRRWTASGGVVYGTFLDGKNIYGEALETGEGAPVLVITGSEADGISPEVAACCTSRLYLPPFPPDDPGSESLNAAVATALTRAEFRRRA